MPDRPGGFPKLAALAVTLVDDQVLLVRRRNPPDAGLWGFPGGHVEPGETALAAAIRELAEETGVIARAVGYLDNVDVIIRDPSGGLSHHFLLAAVFCDYVSGDPVAGDDALEAAWIAVTDVLAGRVAISASVDQLLRRALTHISDHQ
ncbi:NUDIX hydrolase [Paracoccus tegillarcae]|uniref:NUDIX hydrolase n=1 Tax=Paracoccus tegillarcae TaxID=1529068 RepID=A0A2K9EP40_9RHOB|nr:NUDIX hydrolase [Paracoccus tegillarcae]AUH32476.1 NUDIX hydrolase [Paracoccus tegillarcae]